MPRFDISRLRKEKGISQSELATLLQITQSFLSAIENGKSPLPIEKEEKLCEFFGLANLNDYVIENKANKAEGNLNDMTDSDLFNQLLSRFHKQAHSAESEHHHHDHHQKIDELEQRIASLWERNDALMNRNDDLHKENERLRGQIETYRLEIDKLREEIFQIRKL